jgi:hypothetical protein
VGHPIINLSLNWAERRESSVATFPKSVLRHLLLIFRIAASITVSGGIMKSVVVGVEMTLDINSGGMHLLRDWELLLRLNALAEGRGVRRPRSSSLPEDTNMV